MFGEKYNPSELKVIFDKVHDPREQLKVRHPLNEIIFLCVVANMAGIESWRGIEIFAEEKLEFLRQYFPFNEGGPSRHTISRVFSLIKPAFFEALLSEVTRFLRKTPERQMIAIDGKTLRGTSQFRESPLHLLNAVAIDDGISLSQIACLDKSNEITAIPDILRTLELEGAIITIDAMGCQKAIAEGIRKHGADYVLAVKKNQPQLFEAISSYFENNGFTYDNPQYFLETLDKGHGRIERRCYQVAYPPHHLAIRSWKGVHSIAMVVSEIQRKDVVTSQVRFYISSLSPDPKEISRAIRGHWSIENQLHWTLDVVFNEDKDLKRKDYAPRNFAALRKMSLNLIRLFLNSTAGVKETRMRAGLNHNNLDKILKKLFLGFSNS